MTHSNTKQPKPTRAEKTYSDGARSSTSLGGIQLYHILLLSSWLLIAGFFLAWGWSYYMLPLQERPFTEGYNTFKPGGVIGLNLGVIGTLMMAIGVLTYSVRKRVRRFNNFGRLRHWLSFHIFLCSLGPFLVLLHTSFKINGIVAISFISMLIVVVSGITGRFLYVRVPKTINGQVKSLRALEAERASLLERIQGETGLSAETMADLFPPYTPVKVRGFFDAIRIALQFEFEKGRRKKRIIETARTHGLAPSLESAFIRSVRDQIRMERHIKMLTPFQKLFGHWLTIHVPLTIVMGIIVLLHIGVAVALGYVIEF